MTKGLALADHAADLDPAGSRDLVDIVDLVAIEHAQIDGVAGVDRVLTEHVDLLQHSRAP